MKKYILLWTVFFTLTFSSGTFANEFNDVQPNSELHLAINELRSHSVISGYSDGTFRPNNALTRGQIAKMIAVSLNLQPENTNSVFSDVPSSHANYSYVQALVSHEIVNGYPDGTFKPNAVVTRSQAAKMIAAAYSIPSYNATLPFSDIKTTSERYKDIQALYFNGIAVGSSATTFSPANQVTRGQAALFVYRAWQMKKGAVIREITVDNSKSTTIVQQQGQFFKTVIIHNKIRLLPLTDGTGYLFVKGDLDEHYILYEVKSANKKITVSVIDWHDYTEIQFNYYAFDSIQFPHTLQSYAIYNSEGYLVSNDQYFIDYNAEGIELALLTPGKYTLTLTSTNGVQKTYTLLAQFSKFTLQTDIYLK